MATRCNALINTPTPKFTVDTPQGKAKVIINNELPITEEGGIHKYNSTLKIYQFKNEVGIDKKY